MRTGRVTKAHFALTREMFRRGVAVGLYSSARPDFSFKEVEPEYDLFARYMKRVGHPWGWDKMISRFSKKAIEPKFFEKETRLLILKYKGKPVGYCLILKPDTKVGLRFWPRRKKANAIEIENIGLFPEECGQGRGRSFLEIICAELFQTYDIVYLASTSTNHPHIRDFYKRFGMKGLAVDPIEDLRVPAHAQTPIAAE